MCEVVRLDTPDMVGIPGLVVTINDLTVFIDPEWSGLTGIQRIAGQRCHPGISIIMWILGHSTLHIPAWNIE
ncbi:hypothetical protein ASD39_02250 [Sphingomonas sp. Root50]|nr:hypothetical protein ASD17_01055 [Sphingomonas sp. Root1294]KQY69148.1 hypothetical protein ASD39_02250 [Sphingomonas sp. Root50]KRB89403.1 hypothetical protein ASE22_17165 [Sphingomonas sp. Root720]